MCVSILYHMMIMSPQFLISRRERRACALGSLRTLRENTSPFGLNRPSRDVNDHRSPARGVVDPRSSMTCVMDKIPDLELLTTTEAKDPFNIPGSLEIRESSLSQDRFMVSHHYRL